MEKHRAKGTTTRLKASQASSNQWFPVLQNEEFPELFRQFYRVLKKNSHLYVLCDQETMFAFKPMAEAAGFTFWKPIVWDKIQMGMGYHYRNTYEFILFFEKGKRKLQNLGIQDVLHFHKESAKAYPTQKPVNLLKVLVEQSSGPGDVVLDPFMGSGSTGLAAVSCGRQFIGADVQDDAHAVTVQRLKGLGMEDEDGAR